MSKPYYFVSFKHYLSKDWVDDGQTFSTREEAQKHALNLSMSTHSISGYPFAFRVLYFN